MLSIVFDSIVVYKQFYLYIFTLNMFCGSKIPTLEINVRTQPRLQD